MREGKVVIGKNFGDEGKGQTVSCLCRGKDAVVVRHNGGAQAGHTVEDGAFRFVFHQLGSGSRWNCPTYWSETFLPDLLKLGEEVEALRRELWEKTGTRFTGSIYAHGGCAWVTVKDARVNSLTEQLRGKKKHGSCGMGIYETVLRTGEERFSLRLRDFLCAGEAQIAERLRAIREGYVRPRVEKLSVEYPDEFLREEIQEWLALLWDENLCRNAAAEMCANFNRYVSLADWQEISERYETVVFENAQGLMLDEDNREYFPHLTPSHTGLFNVAELLRGDRAQEGAQKEQKAETGQPDLEIFYVTRTYVTRHGAGRLDFECGKEEINPGMTDLTNVPNPWQACLRYARHPAGAEFVRYMEEDLRQLKGIACPVRCTLLVTHANETGGKMLFADKERTISEVSKLLEESVSVFLRRHSFLLVEGLGKVKAVVKAEGVRDRGDRQVGML